MSRNTSVILGDHYDQFIKQEVVKGKYSSASEVIRNGLRLLEERSRRIELINKALEEGENSGEYRDFDNEEFNRRMHSRYSERT